MIERLNPEGAPKPASNYAQAVIHAGRARRIVVSGQVGITLDGRIVQGMEEQLRQCWRNLFAVLEASGFARDDLVKTVIYVTEAGQTALSRKVRDEMLGGLLVASTYVQVAGLAAADFLCEIEGEAVRE
jgi:2-iminobutanoate/2-iminopropanoate deaminase